MGYKPFQIFSVERFDAVEGNRTLQTPPATSVAIASSFII